MLTTFGTLEAKPQSPVFTDDAENLENLVRQVRTRSNAAIEELYGLVRRVAGPHYRRKLAIGDAHDSIHETFLIVLEAIGTGALREPRAVANFIRTVLRHAVAASVRGAIRQRRETDVAECRTLLDQRSSPEELLLKGERNYLVEKSLCELGSRDREILSRFYVQEQRPEQICSEMNLSSSQFRVRKWRAKERLCQAASTLPWIVSKTRGKHGQSGR